MSYQPLTIRWSDASPNDIVVIDDCVSVTSAPLPDGRTTVTVLRATAPPYVRTGLLASLRFGDRRDAGCCGEPPADRL